MATIYSIKPLLAVIVSLLLIPVLVSSRTPNIREGWTFAIAITKFFIVASMLPAVLLGNQIVFTVAEVVPGLAIKFRVDARGMLVALVASLRWSSTSA